MKKLCGIILVINLLICHLILAFPNEPDGFGGIKWGTSIESLNNMVFKQKDPGNKDISLYTDKDETLLWEDIKLERVDYVFYKGKFCQVAFWVKGIVNANLLKAKLFNKYGDALGFRNIETFANWQGEITEILFIYDTKDDSALVQFMSIEFGF